MGPSRTGQVSGRNPDPSQDPKLPIFFDPTSRRRLWFRIVVATLALVFLIWSLGFGASLYMLSKLDRGGRNALVHAQQLAQLPEEPVTISEGPDRDLKANRGALPEARGSTEGAPLEQFQEKWEPVFRPELREYKRLERDRDSEKSGTALAQATIYAYLPYWPEWNYVPLARALPTVKIVMPEWYRLDLTAGAFRPLGLEAAHQLAVARVLRFRSPGQLLPVANVSNLQAGSSVQPGENISRVVSEIVRTVTERRYGGMCFNISGLSPSNDEQIRQLLLAVHEAFRTLGSQTCLVAPLESTIWSDRTVTESIDRAVVLGFRDPGTMTGPAPLAPQSWFSREVPLLVDRIGAAKVVLAIGATAYDWTDGETSPRQLDYAEAMRIAQLHGAEVRFDGASLNTTFSYFDGGYRHEVWMLDAASAYNQLRSISGHAPGGVAVWPLTGADPSVWPVLAARDKAGPPQRLLHQISIADYVGYEGEGAFQRLLHAPQTGMRTIETDPTSGTITGVAYSRLPQPYSILRYGAGEKHAVALTFDDGPDPSYTRKILEILRTYHVPATFFVVGSNALGSSRLLAEMAADGHEIGVHTFFHPELERTPSWRIRFELSATERLIASITGRQTMLFRAPYGRTEGPLTGAEAWAMNEVEKYGYLVVGADIAPPDWTRISPEEIVSLVKSSAHPTIGNVLALHDAGGDRRATVASLPGIIEALRNEGYTFVPLSSFLGKTRQDVMPPDNSPGRTFDAASFEFIRLGGIAVRWTFWAVIVIGIGRACYVVVLAHVRRRHPIPESSFAPPVTVVIPAFCEAPVIGQTISAILASDYPDLKVLVVDDGSTDETAAVARAAGGRDPRIEVISQPNGGKFSALNHAYARIETDIVIGIDADTVIHADAIRMLVRHFKDPAVGAVSGNVKIGNAHTLMTRLQSLEYLTAQNLDRRAAEVFNGILVVPGAIGAWRREAVETAGFYSRQTLAEDADLTVSVVRAGYRVVYEERAFGITQAPESVRQFLRQRLRWMLGMLQTAWKHRGAIGERHWIGLVSIPELFLFGIVMAVLAPIADAMMAAALLNSVVDMIIMQGGEFGDPSGTVMAAYGAFMIVDILMGALAFRFEPGEDKKLLLLLPFQRFLYRQLLYVTAIRALYVALTGRLMMWQKVTHAAAFAPQTDGVARAECRQFQLVRRDETTGGPGSGLSRPMSDSRSRSVGRR